VASPTQQKVVTFGRNLSIKVWDVNTGLTIKSWKGHRLPAICCDAESTGTLVASGGADKLVFVWDLDHGHATHSFKGHEANVTAIKFLPHPHTVERLASGDDTGKLRIWDLLTSSCVAVLSEHYTTITSILFSPDPNGYSMVTAGRDKVLAFWDTRDFNPTQSSSSAPVTPAPKTTITVLEGIEAAITLPIEAVPEQYGKVTDATGSGALKGKEMLFVTAGDAGKLRKWRLTVTGETKADRRYNCTCVQATNIHNLRQGLPAAVGAAASALSTSGSSSSASSAAPGASSADELPVSKQFGGLLLRRKPRVTVSSASTSASSSSSSESAAVGSKRKREGGDALPDPSASTSSPFELIAISRDHVLTCVDSKNLTANRTVVGYADETLDCKYLNEPLVAYPHYGSPQFASKVFNPASLPQGAFIPRLAVATNSEQLRLVDLRSFDTRLCDGHSGIILAVAASPDGSLVATASKDTTLRIWDVLTGHCIAVCEGHTEAVTSVSWPVRPSNFTRLTPSEGPGAAPAVLGSAGWILSGSKDRTLKLWQLSSLLSTLQSPRPADWLSRTDKVFTSPAAKPRTAAAIVAHEKDVNAVAVAPHDRMAATGSQDKSIKLWSLPDLSLIATLRGHRRGVWSVAFSPTDQVLASASGDRTVRLWAATPAAGFACLRSFEGHDASALNVRFLRKGTQLVSCGADGLLKLWEIRGGECLNTFDAHTQKIWALAVRPAELKDVESSSAGSGSASAAASFASKEDKSKKKNNAMEEDGVDKDDAKAPIEEDEERFFEHELVTGGGDSVLNVWNDVTSAEAENAVAATEEALLKQQSLMTAMALRDYKQAVSLTLELDQPRRCGDIMSELLETGPLPVTATLTPAQKDALYRDQMLQELHELHLIEDAAGAAETFSTAAGVTASSSSSSASSKFGPHGSIEGEQKLVAVLKSLNFLHLGRLLIYVREWNTQSRHGILAQNLLFLILRHLPRKTLLLACKAILSLQHYNTQGGGSLKVIAGVGSVLTQGQAGALSLLPSLAPVVDPGDAFGEATATMLQNSGGANAKSSAKDTVTTAAAADLLRSIITAILPYSERHHERLDRLLVASHRVDYTLGAMQVLQPMTEEELAAIGVASDGTSILKSGKKTTSATEGKGRSEYASESEDSSSDDDDSDEEEVEERGKGRY
jgi:WD40 repeat protein